MIIEIAIGLALVYLLFSGVVSGIQEFLSALFDRRGLLLRKGVVRLLGGFGKGSGNAKRILDSLYGHPMIAALSAKASGNPSYIPSRNFAIALTDCLVRDYQAAKPLFEGLPEAVGQMPEGELRHALEVLIDQSRGSAEKLQALIESHFNTAMERVSGWYKKWTQLWLIAIGIALAVLFNVDSIALAQRIAKDATLRADLVEKAEAVVKTGQKQAEADKSIQARDLAQTNSELASRLSEFESLGLPIGWPRAKNGWPQWPYPGILPVFGWLITGLAASLGAPFWFDALSKLVSLRSAGVRPADAATPEQETSTAASPAPAVGIAPSVQPVAANPNASPFISGPITDFESTRLTPVDIEAIQIALGFSLEHASGVIDAATREALRNWQRNKGRLPTGVLDESDVLDLLFRTV